MFFGIKLATTPKSAAVLRLGKMLGFTLLGSAAAFAVAHQADWSVWVPGIAGPVIASLLAGVEKWAQGQP